MKIGLLGFGTVGEGVYQLAQTHPELEIVTVFRRKDGEIPGCTVTHDFSQILNDPEIDTVVEVIGGIEHASEYVLAALRAGKNVVTANKALLAAKYDELLAAAKTSGAKFRASAAVGGSIGWLANLERAKRIQEIDHIHGIFNGTCNYMLDLMTRQQLDYQQVLRQAQDLGYAEADPSADVDGLDTAAKLTISANIAFGISLHHESVPVSGISQINSADITTFTERGYVCKLLGTADKFADRIEAYVQPTLVRSSDATAAVHTNYNLAEFSGSATGTQSFGGQGAGRYPTAYNVLQDLCDLLAGKSFHTDTVPQSEVTAENSTQLHYYLRGDSTDLADWPAAEISAHWDQGILTTAQPVAKMHQWLKAHREVFAAALPRDFQVHEMK
ncbi:homoserine dehydrogenase [Arcanobacterium hippocoleae]|uniref:Homoserine dehydrogenase n=1 Tax=Arcanobacterium hippocoleae TaxID=149017 RepID=A0ABU1T193_9ACTO|nr:homoserine dehydrogenase [Arcanobacterium hippocoleae]MDR6939142.1 homoserine dehydrogenase [Arcanobacterium hippocoleae]